MGGEPVPGSLFREEALEFLARQRGPGEVLRVSATWTGWVFWALLALVVVGFFVMLLVYLMERARAS